MSVGSPAGSNWFFLQSPVGCLRFRSLLCHACWLFGTHNLLSTMKNEIHPEYFETTISCTCGAVYNTRSTVKDIQIGICAGCHPFFTGEQKFIDTAGRVEKFAKRYGSQTARRKKPSLASVSS